eukprot:2123467-Amphidinium_carterae.1
MHDPHTDVEAATRKSTTSTQHALCKLLKTTSTLDQKSQVRVQKLALGRFEESRRQDKPGKVLLA